MRKLTLILSFLIIITNGNSQSQLTTDSLYQNLHEEVNIANPSSDRSDIVWERVSIPEGFILRSFFIDNDRSLLIGSNSGNNPGGIYKTVNNGNTWTHLGLENRRIYFIGNNNSNELIVGADWSVELFDTLGIWNEVYQSHHGSCYAYYNIDSLLFVGNGAVIRSEDDGYNWNIAYLISTSSESALAFTSTNIDSVFMGTVNWVGYGGGVYLSIDNGNNWSTFGLSNYFISSLAVDLNDLVYAGCQGHYYTGQGGLYRLNYSNNNWDDIFLFPYINSIVFNTENHIFVGFDLDRASDQGGIFHSEDNGETWILDTTGMGSTWVHDLQIAENGIMYAIAGYPEKHLYRTTLPVNINDNFEGDHNKTHWIYPNPASSYISIQVEYIELNIYNQLSQKVMYIPDYRNRIDVSALEQGLYVVEIVTEKGSSREKLLIQ